MFSVDTTFSVAVRAHRSDRPIRLETAIYGGLFFDHFGHFMTETAPNLFAVRDAAFTNAQVPIVFHLPPKMEAAEIRLPVQSERISWFVNKAGLDWSRFRFVQDTVRVDRLIVPESPFASRFLYSDHGLTQIDAVLGRRFGGTARTYFSRSKWSIGRLTNEAEIEAFLSARGFDIVHPQDLSLDAQLELIQDTKTLVGPQGTALHWTLYAPELMHVVSLGWPSPLQKGICRSRAQHYREIHGRRPRGAQLRVREISLLELEKGLPAA